MSSKKSKLHVTCPVVRKKTKKTKLYQKTASALPPPSLTASCFQLFSPADQVLSGWILTGGETNKDSQDWANQAASELYFAAGATNSCLFCPGPFISYGSPGHQQFLWTWNASLTLPPKTMSSRFLLTKPLCHYLPSLIQLILIICERCMANFLPFGEYFPFYHI